MSLLLPREVVRYHRQIGALAVASMVAIGASGWGLIRLAYMRPDALAWTQKLLETRDAAERAGIQKLERGRLNLIGLAGQRLLQRTDIDARAKTVPLENLEQLYAFSKQRLADAREPLKGEGKLEAYTYAVTGKGVLPLNASADGQVNEAAVQAMLSSDQDMRRLMDMVRTRAASQSHHDRYAEARAKVATLAAKILRGER